MNRRFLGSDFDDLLREDGLYAEVQTAAIKRIIAHQLERARKRAKLSKSAMAARMRTSRSALDRLLDPRNQAVTLQTLDRAARAVGKRLRVNLI